MSLDSELNKVTRAGTGATASFSFPFVIQSADQLEVTHVAADGTETILSQGTGAGVYSVTVASYPDDGSITYPQDESSFIDTDESLVIRRDVSLTQPTELGVQGRYDPRVQEAVFDRLTMITQQLQEQIDRAFLVPVGSTTVPSTLIASLLEAETSAAASKVAAETAETNAETAETNAEAAADDARATVTTKTADYTAVLADAGGYFRMNGGAADNDFTVPPNSSVAFEVDTELHVEQTSANQTTIVAGAGVTINTSETLKLNKQYAVATLKKVDTDTWTLFGYLEASA